MNNKRKAVHKSVGWILSCISVLSGFGVFFALGGIEQGTLDIFSGLGVVCLCIGTAWISSGLTELTERSGKKCIM